MQDRKSKLRVEEEKEKLSILGQESDLKAKPWIQKELAEQERLARMDWEQDIYQLSKLRVAKPKYYFRFLATLILKFCQEEQIPKKYHIDVSLSDKGVLLKVVGTKYQGAFKPSGLPLYDRHACKLMAVRLGNTIAKLEGYVRQTEGGVVLPDGEDERLYAGNS